MALWNCNGSLWTHPRRLEEVLEHRDIVLLTKTHESLERGLPRIQGYVWESSHKKCMRHRTSRGSGGVAVLYRRELQGKIQIVARDEEAHFIWITVELHYIALCYFAPSGSRFATISGDTAGDDTEAHERDGETLSPYACLIEGIMSYSSLGKVFLMGDFNGRTQSRQCETYDFEDSELLNPIDEAGMENISRHSSAYTLWETLTQVGLTASSRSL
ncbi:hypothetical protein L7F22_005467 [Adiantum nelumboides]|nr:hypothetical protein [Adiantum nelumboides]